MRAQKFCKRSRCWLIDGEVLLLQCAVLVSRLASPAQLHTRLFRQTLQLLVWLPSSTLKPAVSIPALPCLQPEVHLHSAVLLPQPARHART